MEPSTNLINLSLNTEVTCGVSEEQEKITIEFKGTREHSENDDSDFIKKLKATGLISASDFKWVGGYIVSQSSVLLDDPENRDFAYKWLYLERRDAQTRERLNDKQFIRFNLGGQKECIDQESDDENEESDSRYLMYSDFIQNQMIIEQLNGADDLVLPLSECDICFDYPCYDSVVYTIRADDQIAGFTRKELALKIMRYYSMMIFVCRNYDPITGQLDKDDNETKLDKRIFRPVLGYVEWEEKEIRGITYNKEKEYWVCECVDYI